MSNNTLAVVFGTLGTVFWCIQLVPQIWFNWRRKNCEGFPPLMMLLWVVSAVPFGAYFVNQNSTLPLQIQPQVFMVFCSVTLAQALIYPPVQWRPFKTFISMSVLLVLCAGIECALIFPIRPLVEEGIKWPNLIIGVIASVLLAAGLLPPYFELWKHKGRAVGFNFVFLAMDSSGAIFSLIAVAFQDELDILGLILYIVVLVMEFGIFFSHFVWWIRVKYFGLIPVPLTDFATESDGKNDDRDECCRDYSSTVSGRTDHHLSMPKHERVLPVVDPIQEIHDIRHAHDSSSHHQA